MLNKELAINAGRRIMRMILENLWISPPWIIHRLRLIRDFAMRYRNCLFAFRQGIELHLNNTMISAFFAQLAERHLISGPCLGDLIR